MSQDQEAVHVIGAMNRATEPNLPWGSSAATCFDGDCKDDAPTTTGRQSSEEKGETRRNDELSSEIFGFQNTDLGEKEEPAQNLLRTNVDNNDVGKVLTRRRITRLKRRWRPAHPGYINDNGNASVSLESTWRSDNAFGAGVMHLLANTSHGLLFLSGLERHDEALACRRSLGYGLDLSRGLGISPRMGNTLTSCRRRRMCFKDSRECGIMDTFSDNSEEESMQEIIQATSTQLVQSFENTSLGDNQNVYQGVAGEANVILDLPRAVNETIYGCEGNANNNSSSGRRTVINIAPAKVIYEDRDHFRLDDEEDTDSGLDIVCPCPEECADGKGKREWTCHIVTRESKKATEPRPKYCPGDWEDEETAKMRTDVILTCKCAPEQKPKEEPVKTKSSTNPACKEARSAHSQGGVGPADQKSGEKTTPTTSRSMQTRSGVIISEAASLEIRYVDDDTVTPNNSRRSSADQEYSPLDPEILESQPAVAKSQASSIFRTKSQASSIGPEIQESQPTVAKSQASSIFPTKSQASSIGPEIQKSQPTVAKSQASSIFQTKSQASSVQQANEEERHEEGQGDQDADGMAEGQEAEEPAQDAAPVEDEAVEESADIEAEDVHEDVEEDQVHKVESQPQNEELEEQEESEETLPVDGYPDGALDENVPLDSTLAEISEAQEKEADASN